jgi:hypothetical protein
LEKNLHIISLNVPYPVDYGGVYDLFYKLPALQSQEVKIYLHCFEYGRGEQAELKKYCKEVYYYKRNKGYKSLSAKIPYIVSTRRNEELLKRLLKDDYPIFMEGVHCTYPVKDKRFNNRKKFIRIHNVENQYYRQLFSCSHNPLKKIYYLWESRLLKEYEQELVNAATAFWTVTQKDNLYYRNELHCPSVDYLPLFLPFWEVEYKEGMGSFCLYHGNLEVEENEYAAEWLLKHVFNKSEIPFVVAGKNPSRTLKKLCSARRNTCLVANPSEKELQDMIAKSQINILPSFSNTGIKLKLLNALFNGRHCLVNPLMVEGTGLDELCSIADGTDIIKERVEKLFHQPFTIQEIEARRNLLYDNYDNTINAKQIVKWIWGPFA